jgi:hypothetical protein
MFDSSRSVRSRSQRLQATAGTRRRAGNPAEQDDTSEHGRILVERVAEPLRFAVTR